MVSLDSAIQALPCPFGEVSVRTSQAFSAEAALGTARTAIRIRFLNTSVVWLALRNGIGIGLLHELCCFHVL